MASTVTTPPPVRRILPEHAPARAVSSCSRARKAASPPWAKISGIEQPARASMRWSMSMASRPVRAARAAPTVEVHISDPDTREEFRHTSYIRAACTATIRGHGLAGYVEALRLLCGTQASAPI